MDYNMENYGNNDKMENIQNQMKLLVIFQMIIYHHQKKDISSVSNSSSTCHDNNSIP